jgi:hypothetical protein
MGKLRRVRGGHPADANAKRLLLVRLLPCKLAIVNTLGRKGRCLIRKISRKDEMCFYQSALSVIQQGKSLITF